MRDPRAIRGEIPRYVRRDEIRATTRIQASSERLQETVSRLRTELLRPAVSAFYAALGCDVPAEVLKHCYIGPPRAYNRKSQAVGDGPRAAEGHPFELLLEPHQVSILCDRPAAFGPRKSSPS